MPEGIAVEILLLFVVFWLISPIVLGIICAVQHSKIVRLEKKLKDTAKASPQNTPYPSDNTNASVPARITAEKPEKIPAAVSDNVVSEPPKSADIPKKTYSYSPAAAEKKPKSHANVILILGAMFIILAGFVFAAAAWWALNSFFKSAVLLSFSALFFGLHAFSSKKLGLETAGRVFYVLGSVFLPVSFAAGAALGVFGEIFTFSHGNTAATLSVMFLLLSAAFFVGAHIYNIRGYAKTAYISLTAALAFIMLHFGNVFCAAAMAVLSLLAIIFQPLMEKKLSGAISQEYHLFASVNTWALAIISLFISEGGGAFVLPAVLFSAAFFTRAVKGKSSASGMYPMCAYFLIGTMTGIRPDSLDGYVLIGAAVMIVFTVLGMMDALPVEIKTASEKISAFFSCAVIGFGLLRSVLSGGLEHFETTALISAAMITIQLGIISLRTDKNVLKALMSASFCWLCYELARMLCAFTPLGALSLTVMSAVLALYFFLIKFTGIKKCFYSSVSDILIGAALALTLILQDISVIGAGWGMVHWLLLMAVLFASGTDEPFGRGALPFGFILSAYAISPIYFLQKSEDAYFCPNVPEALICGMVIYCIGAAAVLIKPLRKYSAPMSMGIPVLSLIQMIFFFSEKELYALYGGLAILAFSALNFITNREHKRFGAYLGYFLGALCCLVYETAFISMPPESSLNALIFPAVLMFLLFGISIFPGIYETKLSDKMMFFLWWSMPVYSVILGSGSAGEQFGAGVICALLLAAFGCGAAVIRKNSALSLVSLIVIDISVYCYMLDSGYSVIAVIALGIVCALAGRALYSEGIIFGRDFDMLSLSSFTSCGILLLAETGKYGRWLGFLLLGLLLLDLIRKQTSAAHKKALFAAAGCTLLPVWWTQPFLEIPEIFVTEVSIIPVAVVCGLIMFIYRSRPEPAANISFAAAVISLVVLFIDAVRTGYAADAVMLGIVIVGILLVSFALRRKRWFALSAASAAAEAIVLTLRLWNSRTWWIYLLAAGVILIALGMANERKKQQKDGERSGLSKLMSDWKW